ncbi:MAG TPA: NAD(P)/FAD-dependent oxidoreductase [Dehalococcoidia bacterium]|jgi:prolycopene isomerase
MDAEVVIIGGGFGGLSTGALLASKGVNVLLLEKNEVLGGRAKSVGKEGFIVDNGPHSNRFAADGPAAAVLKSVGQNLEFVKEEGSPSYVYHKRKLVKLPSSAQEFLTTELLSEQARAEMVKVLAQMLLENPDEWYPRTLLEFINKFTNNEEVRGFFRLMGLFIIAPQIEETSAGEVMYFMQQAQKSAQAMATPVAGTRQIIEKLSAVIEGRGQIRKGAKVDQILVKQGTVTGVKVGKEVFTSKAVVFTLPVQQLFSVIEPGYFPPTFVNYARNLIPTSGVSIDFGLGEPVSDLSGGIMDIDLMVMGNFPSNLDPSLAPKGKQLSSWAMILPHQLKEKAAARNALSRLHNLISELYPRFFDYVEWQRPQVYSILDGVLLKVGQAYPDRHQLRSPHVEKLFFAGDTAKAKGCSGDIAFNSALEVSSLILSSI